MAKSFMYHARDRTGQAINGTIVADNQAAVAAFVKQKGYFVTKITEESQGISLTSNLSAISFKDINLALTSVKLKDLAVLCRQFATMVEAGLSFLVCLNILHQQTENPLLKDALQNVYKKVQDGESLTKAMGSYPRVFPVIMLGMIEAGELGGVLDVSLNRLAVQFEKEYKLEQKVKSAMTYPVVVISMAILVIMFVLTFVLPTFMKMFENSKVELPLITRVLLNVSGFLEANWPLLLLLAGGAIAAAPFLYRRPAVKYPVDMFLIKLPILGLLKRKAIIARFSRTLATLLRGGMPIITALDVVKKTTNHSGMTRTLENADTQVREGTGLATPLAGSPLFTPMAVQMIAVGEETGDLDQMLDRVADFYESEVDDMVASLSSLIEPVLIVVLGVIIGGIVLAVMMPMFDAVTSIGR